MTYDGRIKKIVGEVNWDELIPEAKSDFRCAECDEMHPWQEEMEAKLDFGGGRGYSHMSVCRGCVKKFEDHQRAMGKLK